MKRAGMSLVEVLVAIIILGVTVAFVSRITGSISQYGRTTDLRRKRTLALEQQVNFVGALPFDSIKASILPASKTYTAGDFTYTRRIAIAKTPAAAPTQATVTIVIVPTTSAPADSLSKDSAVVVRSKPACGTVLNVGAC